MLTYILYFVIEFVAMLAVAGFLGGYATRGFWSGFVINLLGLWCILNITLRHGIESYFYIILLFAFFLVFLFKSFTAKKLFKHVRGSSDLLNEQQTYVISFILGLSCLFCYAMKLPVSDAPLWIHYILATLCVMICSQCFSSHKTAYKLIVDQVINYGYADPSKIINELLKDVKELKDKDSFVAIVLSDMEKWKKNNATKVQGKSELYFLKEIYDRIILDFKEKKNESAVQLDIQNKFNKIIPYDVIATVHSSVNVTTVVEYDNLIKNFTMMKYAFDKHPVKELKIGRKRAYIKVLQHIILQNCGKSSVTNGMLTRAQAAFGVGEPVQLLSESDLNSSIADIKRKVFEYKFPLSFSRKEYKYLLITESFYIVCLIVGHLNYDSLKHYCELLKISPKDEALITDFLEAEFMHDKNPDTLIEECKNKYLRLAMEYIHKNIYWNKIYYSLPRYSVAVCATMSSGKSTFVNALLGYDYIPSSNQACTAKITSISDNDYLNKVIGCSIAENNKADYNECVDREILEKWNENDNVKRIVLEGDLEEVSSKSGVLVIHDTPGTNFSQNDTHSQQTIDFLKKNKLDLIIYLINAEHSSTTDNTILLKQILEICRIHPQTQMLFLVNKLDSFDIEGGDDIKECIEGVRKELASLGFPSPMILPIIANGARLFKMVLKGETLTKREILTFEDSYEFCMNESGAIFDATNPEYTGFTFNDFNKSVDGEVVVGQKAYRKKDLQEALKRSGITMVTQILDNQINGRR